MPVVFLLGIMGIAFEDVIRVNKAATAVGMSIILWVIFLLNADHFFVINPPKHINEFVSAFPRLLETKSHLVYWHFQQTRKG